MSPPRVAPVGVSNREFFGKYPGKVKDNLDPEGRGRLLVEVPSVRGSGVLDWALPAAPYAGDGVGFFALPPVEADVWVEYVAGAMNRPIWTGCFWTRGQIPAADAVPEVVFLKTPLGSLRFDQTTGEIKIENGMASITITASEVKIEASQITQSANGATTQLSAAGFDALQGALKVV